MPASIQAPWSARRVERQHIRITGPGSAEGAAYVIADVYGPNMSANAALILESPERDALLIEAIALGVVTPEWLARAAASHARSRGTAP